MDLLKKHHSYPIEREFEAWIVSGIEAYFRHVGKRGVVFAVTPSEEASWPADEQVHVDGKIIGIQVKRAAVSILPGKPVNISRLRWSLSSPPGQMKLVRSFPELWYCLPTFVNRAYRREALHHALFWRPGNSTDSNLWYNNPDAHSSYNNVAADENRRSWGELVSAVLSCDEGKRVRSVDHVNDYLAALTSFAFWEGDFAATSRSQDGLER